MLCYTAVGSDSCMGASQTHLPLSLLSLPLKFINIFIPNKYAFYYQRLSCGFWIWSNQTWMSGSSKDAPGLLLYNHRHPLPWTDYTQSPISLIRRNGCITDDQCWCMWHAVDFFPSQRGIFPSGSPSGLFALFLRVSGQRGSQMFKALQAKQCFVTLGSK